MVFIKRESTSLSLHSYNIVRVTKDSLQKGSKSMQQNQIYLFLFSNTFFFLVKTLVPTLPTMQLDHQQFNQEIQVSYASRGFSAEFLMSESRHHNTPESADVRPYNQVKTSAAIYLSQHLWAKTAYHSLKIQFRMDNCHSRWYPTIFGGV